MDEKNKEHDVLNRISGLNSPRFSQIASFARLPVSTELDEVDSVFLGVPFDSGTTYRTGARFGPSSVREESRILRPFSLSSLTTPFTTLKVIDYGDVMVYPVDIIKTLETVSTTLDPIFAKGIFPMICGGDHSITYGVLESFHKNLGEGTLIHFDSHFDFWNEYQGYPYNHGTWLRRAKEKKFVNKVLQIGIRGSAYSKEDLEYAEEQKIHVHSIYSIRKNGFEGTISSILDSIDDNTPVHISIDIDSVDPAFAPGTGTPEVGGLTSWEITESVRLLMSKNVKSIDVVEISPSYDNAGKITSVLGANIFYESLAAYAKKR
ncbi:MAG: agmatinase [Thermoplasmataceae archaeon]|jgi:agmatinase